MLVELLDEEYDNTFKVFAYFIVGVSNQALMIVCYETVYNVQKILHPIYSHSWSTKSEGGFKLESRSADKEPKNQDWLF